MGLDLYAGTLTRYHTQAWELAAQRVVREAGTKFTVVYPDGAPRRLGRMSAPLLVRLWRRRIRRKYRHLITQGLEWPEASSTPYLSWKPDHDGQMALVLAAAHAECPEFPLPTELPQDRESDAAYASISSEDYLRSIVCVLDSHMFLPSEENFLIASPDAAGTKRFISSTANLQWALDTVNETLWRADASQIDAWEERGAPTRKVLRIEGGKVVKEEDVAPPENPFQHLAQFGFAVYSAALSFSRAHNVPIVTDA